MGYAKITPIKTLVVSVILIYEMQSMSSVPWKMIISWIISLLFSRRVQVVPIIINIKIFLLLFHSGKVVDKERVEGFYTQTVTQLQAILLTF